MASSPRVIVRKKTFDNRKEESFNSSFHKNNSSQKSTKSNKRQLNDKLMVDNKNGVPTVSKFDESSRSFFPDEDYIVFCFDKDGPFDVVKDDKGRVHKFARPLKLQVCSYFHFLRKLFT